MINLEQKELTQEQVFSEFDTYLRENPDQARKLKLPNEVLDILVPNAVRKVASDPRNLEVSSIGNSNEGLSIIIVEHNYPEQLTDPSIWERWMAQIENAKKEQEGKLIKFTPEAPEGINNLHAIFWSEVKSGRLLLSDRILMSVNLNVLSEASDILSVGDYQGESQKGIGRDFYLNTLPDFARKLGFRFMVGLNNAINLSFFTQTLGRYTYREIKPEYREQLFPNADPKILSTDCSTVQFLYPEDKEKYVITGLSLGTIERK